MEIIFFIKYASLHMALLLLLLVSAFGMGALGVQITGFRDRLSLRFYLYSIALGLGILGHLVLGLGALRLLFPEIAWTLIFLGLAVTLIEFIRNHKEYGQLTTRFHLPKKIHWFSAVLVFVLVINWLYPLLVNALVPALSWDEVAYHLAIPGIYIRNHAISYISFIPYSNWPLQTELLFTLSLLISSEPLAHLITWMSFVMVCASLFLFGRRYFSNHTGLLAAVIFASTPMVTTLAGTALIELPLTMYTLFAVMTLLEWMETRSSYAWILSAIFGGLAASTKLNAALVPLFLGSFFAIASLLVQRTSLVESVKRFIQYGLLAFIVVAPWYAKNWIQTGSPFWPFLYPILGGHNWDLLGNEYLFGFIRRPNMPITPVRWLLGLWKLTFDAVEFGPYRVTLGWFYIFLLPLSLPSLWLAEPGQRRMVRALALLGIVFYTSWFFQTHQTRFLMPTTSILAILSAAGITWLWGTAGGKFRTIIQLGLSIALIGSSWLAKPEDRDQITSHWPYLSGQVTRNQYLSTKIPGYEAFVYANDNLPPDAYVLLALYESRGYYLEREYMWANPISQRALRLEQFSSPEELAVDLKSRGITHILFLSNLVDNYTYIRYGETITNLVRTLLANHAHLIYTSSPLELYELTP